jgi:AraC-like DNA-binding protein
VYHETYTVCTILSEETDWTYRGQRLRSGPGRLAIMEPGEVHVTNALSGPCTFSVALVPPALVSEIAADLGIRDPPHLDANRALDPSLWQAFAGLHAALRDPNASQLRRQAVLADCLATLLARTTEGPLRGRPEAGRRAVARARRYIDESFERDIGLDELASVAGLSPYHLSREFARRVGVPPHRYHTLVRVERARALLLKRVPGSTAAATVGFCDQSHMIRCFKRVWGVSPTAYLNGGRRD